MYVCELDHPWTDTPFLLQGIMIEGVDDISQVQQT